jgi:D-sedoheptulose 7-phosphate isomerase
MPSINNSLQDFSTLIDNHISSSVEILKHISSDLNNPIFKAVNQIIKTFKKGGKLLIAGNGGSAADAQHFAAEFIIRLTSKSTRPSLPAISLTTDTSVLTAGSNDFGFEQIFKRQLEGLAKPQDCFIAISTSGDSKNLVEALKFTKSVKIPSISLLGNNGGRMSGYTDFPIIINSSNTMHIQEAHICVYHIICDLVERSLF